MFRTAATLVAVLLLAPPARCEADGGKLWGISLCGPMLFADPVTRTLASSQPAPSAPWPAGLGYFGAPVEWGGTRWAAYPWSELLAGDANRRGRFLIHELFHRIQPQLQLMTTGGANNHLESFLGDFRYRSGAGYGLLLDAASPGWPRRIGPTDDLGQLLASALGVQPSDNPDAAAQRYDGAELRRAEDAREVDRQRRIADLRRRFSLSPVVVMPRARSVAVTSTGRTPIPDVGTVIFGGYRATTEWGRLESTDAILESNDDTLRLPAPFRTEGATLSGSGWTIVLADGWIVRPGAGSGNFEVVRAPVNK